MAGLVNAKTEHSSLFMIFCTWQNVESRGRCGFLRDGSGSFEGIKYCAFANITTKLFETEKILIDHVSVMKMSKMEDCRVESSMNVLEGGIVSGTEGSVFFSCNNCTFAHNERMDRKVRNANRVETTKTQTFTNAEWIGCNASCGGALYVHDNSLATLNVENSSFVKCNATSTRGGGIFASKIGECTVKHSSFVECYCVASTNYGGAGAEIEEMAIQVFVGNCLFRDGWSGNDGGGLGIWSSKTTKTKDCVLDCFFQNCSGHCSTNTDGGGLIHWYPVDKIVVHNCLFEGCYSPYHGGGMSMMVRNYGGDIVGFCFFHKNSAPNGNDVYVDDNSKNSQLFNCYSTRTEGVRYYAGGDKSEWLPNGGRCRFVASKENQINAKDTFSCGLNENYACNTISHCIGQLIPDYVKDVKVMHGTIEELNEVNVESNDYTISGVESEGCGVVMKMNSEGLSLFSVVTGNLDVSDLSVIHNTSFDNNRQCRIFEVRGAGKIEARRLNISMDAAHSEERSILNSLVKVDGGELIMKDVKWGQTFITTNVISLSQGSTVSLSLDNCMFSNIVRTTAGSSLMNVGEGPHSTTLKGCTLDGCGSEDSDFGGGMMIEIGSGDSLSVNGGVVRNCYASATQGRGGGIGLKVKDRNAEFLISSAFEGNRAKLGSDIFVDSIDLELTTTSGKITSVTASFDTKNKVQGYDNGDESFPIPLCVYLWNNFSAPAFVGGGSLSHDFSKCGFEEFPCSSISKAASIHFEGKKKDITILEPFAFEEELVLTSDEWSITPKENVTKCNVSDQNEGTRKGLIENSVPVSVTGIVFSLKKLLTFHESVFECHSGKLTLNGCGMEGGTDSISTVFVKAVGGAMEVIEFSTKNMRIGDSSIFVVEGNAKSVPSMNMTKSDFGEITFGDGCVVECHKGIIEKITGCTFSSITRSKGSGGCISVLNNDVGSDCKVKINDCTFEGCSVVGEEEEIGGGALFCEESSKTNLLINLCSFYCCTAPYEEGSVGYGGGIMLKILKEEEEGKAGFVISSPVFSSEKPNNAKYGKDLFISSPSLAKSAKDETLPFVKDRLELLTEDSIRGYDGENKECAIPLIYFWKSIGSSVYIAHKGNDVAVCGFQNLPCKSVDYGLNRGSNSSVEVISIHGVCDVNSVMGTNGMKLEGTKMESDKIQFIQALEGNGDAAVECKGVVQFSELGILIPSSFDNGANILIQTGSDAVKTSVVSCSIHTNENVTDEVIFVLISALKGFVEIEKTNIAEFSTMNEIMRISEDCATTMNDVTFVDISLSGKSAFAFTENEISGRMNENAGVEWSILFEQCTFVNVRQNASNNPSLLCCDVPNDVKLKMENSSINNCGSTSSHEGGGVFFRLNERGRLEMNHTNVTECFCSNVGRGGGLFLKSQSASQKALTFVLSNITFLRNVALKGRDVFVKCTDLDSQISESQFLINFGEPFVKELAIWGSTSDNFRDEEDLLRRVFVFRSEFIFVSSIMENSSDSKNCGEMKSACSSLNVGMDHVIPSDYSQLLIWNETNLKGSCSTQRTAIKSMDSSKNSLIMVAEIHSDGMSVITTSDSVRFEKVSFVFNEMQVVDCLCIINQLNGSLILEFVSFQSESRSFDISENPFDFSLLEVENGMLEANGCSICGLQLTKSAFIVLGSGSTKFEALTICDVQCLCSVIDCGSCETMSVCRLAATNSSLEKGCVISLGNNPSMNFSLLLSTFVNISRNTAGPCISCATHTMTAYEICNCSFSKCTSESEEGSQMTITSVRNALIDSCKFEGGEICDEIENSSLIEICKWNGSLVDVAKSNARMKDTTMWNSKVGGLSVRGGSVEIEDCKFENNNPSSEKYPSIRRNILCSDSGTVNVISLKGGDGLKDNTSLWILDEGCTLEGIAGERPSALFIPVLESAEMGRGGEKISLSVRGKLLVPCNLSVRVCFRNGSEEHIEGHEIEEDGYVGENEIQTAILSAQLAAVGAETEVSVCILFGRKDAPSSTEAFILKNRSEIQGNSDERIAEGGKEGKSLWPIIVIIMAIILMIVIIASVVVTIRWRKQKRRTEELEEIVNDNIRKDPKAFEMVTMEMSPEEQWRRVSGDVEKKNDERIKKRVYEKSLGHSESSEHLLSESGSTEYILGRDSDKIPEWALEKVEEEEIRKRSPSPSISSTSTTDTSDTESTFVRGEDLCPTTSSMSNLVDAMACSSPHEKLIVDLRDSLFMLLHGRNAKKEMAIGTLKEREMTAAQILFWVANGALHAFEDEEDGLPSLANLSPHIVLFSEHMVICIALHSDCSSDSDSSSVSSLTIVSSSSNISVLSERFTDSPPPSSAFEEEDEFKKECLRWKAPELQMNKKLEATEKSVAFSIGMMLWECLTLTIPFGEYEAVIAGDKIANGERPDLRRLEGNSYENVARASLSGAAGERPTLSELRREFVGHFGGKAAMVTMSDAIELCGSGEGDESATKSVTNSGENSRMSSRRSGRRSDREARGTAEKGQNEGAV